MRPGISIQYEISDFESLTFTIILHILIKKSLNIDKSLQKEMKLFIQKRSGRPDDSYSSSKAFAHTAGLDTKGFSGNKKTSRLCSSAEFFQ